MGSYTWTGTTTNNMTGCPAGYFRHWFTKRGHIGWPTFNCVRCGVRNPKFYGPQSSEETT